LLDLYNVRIPDSYFTTQIKPLIASDRIPAQIKVQWGAARRAASIRSIPTVRKMFEKPNDIEFDQLQYTLIKLWTPVAIYHTTSDGNWYYVQAPYVRGWVKASDITVFPDRDSLKNYARSQKFIMVTGESIAVYADASHQAVRLYPSMGTRIPLAEQTESSFVVWLPSANAKSQTKVEKAYVRRESDVSVGFPAYTSANVIRQAFKLLGARYGWGGTYQGRDCSGFTHDVFLAFGIDLPRDSSQQGYIGIQLSHFETHEEDDNKRYFLQRARPGVTLIAMPMHMMLYLGEENGQFYVIHSTWAERISMTSDDKRRINQVVVTDMTLNGNSYLGSLFDRTITINEVQ